jgi:hypothetical protein
LVAATKDGDIRKIAVKGPSLANAPSIRLLPGQSLVGAGADAGVNASIKTPGEGARGFNVYER